MNKRVTHVESSRMNKNPIIDSEIIENLNISVEALERKNREISKSLEQTKFGLLQLSGQLDVARTQEVGTRSTRNATRVGRKLLRLSQLFAHSATFLVTLSREPRHAQKAKATAAFAACARQAFACTCDSYQNII